MSGPTAPIRLVRIAPCARRRAARAVRAAARAVVALALAGAVATPALRAEAAGARAPAADAPWLDVALSDADRRHLLARTGIGVAPRDYAALAGLTRRAGVAHVLARLATEPRLPMPAYTRRPPPHYHAREDMDEPSRRAFDRARDAELAALRRWWSAEMLLTESPQTERLVWLLHDHFATSVLGTNRSTLAMARQNATFRRLHSGPWETLLVAMLEDAALLEFLDAGSNRAHAPNENLARELLERFALGDVEIAWDERDVREAARALAGREIRDVPGLAFRRATWDEDRGPKTLFGVTGPHDARALVRLVLAQDAAARHLARVWWHGFVSDAPPDPAELEALAGPFRDSGHELRALHRATLESEAFWSEEHRAGLVKSPVDLAVGLARTLEYPKRHVDALATLLAGLGQSPFAPPDVGGWSEGAAWVAPGRLLARHAAAGTLALDGAAPTGAEPGAPDGAGTAGSTVGGGESMYPSMGPSMGTPMGTSMGGTTMDGTIGPDDGRGGLSLRLASDELDGPVVLGVTLLGAGAALWDSGERAVPGGHDRARFGPLDASAGRPWRTLRLAAPADAVAAADEVRVRFVNDAADARGDRNLYLEAISLGGRRVPASAGRQASACPPDNPSDAGDLYCAGVLAVPFAPATDPVPRPTDVPSAAAARLRWASVDARTGRASATVVLEHLEVPTTEGGGPIVQELLELRLVSEAPGRLDLHLDSYGCRGECVARWPDCAWVDERFAAARGVSLALQPRTDGGRACVERELGPSGAGPMLALEPALPALLRAILDGRGAAVRRHAAAFAEVRARLDAAVAAGAPDDPERAVAIDARWAPPEPPPGAPAPVRPAVGSLDALVEALAPLGIDPLELLLPGIEGAGATVTGSLDGADARARLGATLDDPLFQLR